MYFEQRVKRGGLGSEELGQAIKGNRTKTTAGEEKRDGRKGGRCREG